MWIYQWDATEGGNARAVVSRARAAHLSTLYVRTGSTYDGYTGGPVLDALLPATRGSGLQVVAWDFPELIHPYADALRLARAAVELRHVPGMPRVVAVAPDIETAAEGTVISGLRVRAYLSYLRHHIPRDVAILATVPWPSPDRAGFPYGDVAAYADAFIPMDYWYDADPATVVAQSFLQLRRYRRPILPVGQGYDSRLDAPSLRPSHPAKELPAFFRIAHDYGARGVSLWSWQVAGGIQWRLLSGASRLFPGPDRAGPVVPGRPGPPGEELRSRRTAGFPGPDAGSSG